MLNDELVERNNFHPYLLVQEVIPLIIRDFHNINLRDPAVKNSTVILFQILNNVNNGTIILVTLNKESVLM
jgi:hypothetical protein